MIARTTRLGRRSSADLRTIQRATGRIVELTVILDRQILADPRPVERQRYLRQAMGQITRTANDAIQAYRRVTQALRLEEQRDDADREELAQASQSLSEARADMLEALSVAAKRYPSGSQAAGGD